MPLAPVGFSLQSFVPYQEPYRLSTAAALLSFSVPHLDRIATQWRSRLQGLALLESPAPAARWLGLRLPVALLGFSPSRVTHSAHRTRCFHRVPLLSFTAHRRNNAGRDFRGLPIELHGWSPQRLPTLMGFVHLVKFAGG